MKKNSIYVFITGLLFTMVFHSCEPAPPVKVYALNESLLQSSKGKLKNNDPLTVKAVAEEIIKINSLKSISSQILEDGSQPYELARTQSWHYSIMNLKGFFTIANLAKDLDVDLGHYQHNNQILLQKALDFFIPYLKDDKKWEYPQITEMDYSSTCFILRMGTFFYDNPVYEELINKH